MRPGDEQKRLPLSSFRVVKLHFTGLNAWHDFSLSSLFVFVFQDFGHLYPASLFRGAHARSDDGE